MENRPGHRVNGTVWVTVSIAASLALIAQLDFAPALSATSGCPTRSASPVVVNVRDKGATGEAKGTIPAPSRLPLMRSRQKAVRPHSRWHLHGQRGGQQSAVSKIQRDSQGSKCRCC